VAALLEKSQKCLSDLVSGHVFVARRGGSVRVDYNISPSFVFSEIRRFLIAEMSIRNRGPRG
jgi:hypothetical protein